MTNISIDEAEGGHRGAGSLEGGHAGGTSPSAVRPGHQAGPAAEQLSVELFPESLAQQVEGKRVHTGVGEGQEAGTDAGDEVEHGGVHLGVVVGAVQVDDVVGEPAEGEEAHEHQHCLGKALPGFDLRRESQTDRGTRSSVGAMQRQRCGQGKREKELGKQLSSASHRKGLSRRSRTRKNQVKWEKIHRNRQEKGKTARNRATEEPGGRHPRGRAQEGGLRTDL